jgi:hypothetical protein
MICSLLNRITKEANRLRRKSNCYLLSSKFLLTISICLISYFITMDIILLNKIKTRNLSINNINHITPKYSPFRPLPVKKIMMADATHYIRSPLAELTELKLHFSEIFPFMSANTISVLHCILSILCVRFFISDSLFTRQIGVVIFQFRNYLDSLDGVIYRAHANKHVYKSHYGSLGYYVDAVSDVFGGLCIIGSMAIHLLKNPPKKQSKYFRLSIDDVELSSSTSSSYLTGANFISNSNQKLLSQNNTYNQQYESKAIILIYVLSIGIRFGLSALFWDRSVHSYEDLLDSKPQNELHKQLQINVLNSSITIFIMLMWRFMNALSLQDMILASIFIDKIWVYISLYTHLIHQKVIYRFN